MQCAVTILDYKILPQRAARFDQLTPLSPLLQSGFGGNNIGEFVWDSEAVEQGT